MKYKIYIDDKYLEDVEIPFIINKTGLTEDPVENIINLEVANHKNIGDYFNKKYNNIKYKYVNMRGTLAGKPVVNFITR